MTGALFLAAAVVVLLLLLGLDVLVTLRAGR